MKTQVRQHLKRLNDLSATIRGTSAFLSFSTLLAGCVRLKQSPTPFETLYLVHLADYLSYMGLGGVWISCSLKMGPLTKVSLNTIYILCEITNKILGDYLNNAARRELISSLARQHMQLQPFLALQSQGSTQDQSNPDKYDEIGKAWISNGPLPWLMWPIALVLGLLLGLVPLSLAVYNRPFPRVRRATDINILQLIRQAIFSKTTFSIFLVFMNLFIFTLTLRSGWKLWNARTRMSIPNGSTNLNEWGFGQITAVLLWAPTTFWIIRNFLRLIPWLRIVLSVVTKFSSSSSEPPLLTSEPSSSTTIKFDQKI